jgi:hypothetical protein
MPRLCLRSAWLHRVLTLSVLLLVLGGAAAAHAGDDPPDPPDLSGSYAVAGTLADGTEYTGTMELKKKTSVKWRKGGPRYNSYGVKANYSINWKGEGVATFIDGRLYVAVAKDSKYLGLSVKRPVVLPPELRDLQRQYLAAQRKNRETGFKKVVSIKGDPWWTDIWFHGHYGVVFRADGAWGVETVGRLDDGRECPPLGEGRWTCVRHYYEDNGKQNVLDYKSGEFQLEKVGDAWRASYAYWLPDKNRHDEPLHCAAFMPDANTVVNVLNGDGSDAIAYYNIEGRKFVGRSCETNGLPIATETVTVPDDVAAKNPELFR